MVAALVLGAETASAETLTYTYDVHGQLVSADSSAGPTVTYAYDEAGNRIELDVASGEGLLLAGDSPETSVSEYPSQEASAGAADGDVRD